MTPDSLPREKAFMKFRHRIVSALVLFLVASVALRGQTPQGKLSFDVATVKPAAPLDMQRLAADMQAGRMPKIGPQIGFSRATYTHMSLADLIALAFNMRAYQISGPAWLAQELFDIEATIPEGATKDDVPAMLRALLEERFKLVAHQAQEEHKVLGLAVGKSGVKMKESPTAPQAFDPNSPLQPGERQVDNVDGPIRMKINSDGTITVNMGAKGTIIEKIDRQSMMLDMKSSGVTMDGFAELLSSIFLQMGGANSRQVVDMTGLRGYYQVDVEISIIDMTAQARSQAVTIPERPSSGSAATSAPPTAGVSEPTGGLSVFDSVERLGLKLEDRKATVDRLVIDQMEKTPTEN
jgi:uncharacterized protein (TIGR03435 family)